MFDSTPLKRARPAHQNEIVYETAMARNASRFRAAQTATARNRGGERYFDIIAVWDGCLIELRSQVDLVSNWGPYELYECIPLYTGADGQRRVLCRFYYHGAASDRLAANTQAQFKFALLNCLRQVAEWEDVAGQADAAGGNV